MASIRMGELLKARGLLDDSQIEQILSRQQESGHPFGAVAAEMFGVQEAELWRAWAMQMIECCPKVHPGQLKVDPIAVDFVTSREAWAYRMLPFELNDEELMICTTKERLPNAMAFAQIKATVPVVFFLCEKDELEVAICRYYGVDPISKAA